MLYLFLSMIEDPIDKLIFEDIYKKYENASMRRAQKMLARKEDAEDAFQMAWFQISQNLDKIQCRDDAAIATYIMKTIEYKVIDVVNQNKGYQENIEPAEYRPKEYVAEDIMYMVCKNERYEMIVRAIDQMDDRYKDIMIFTYLHGFDVPNIAKQLNINEKTVWTRLYRGRKLLIEELKKRGITNE